ncbi:iron-containing alcohol dehydrogenase [Amylibacter sp. SFDW26]|uniref:iron-containing alcohol dehydrogenase n=1 Tax=Amylibacter sp. SFDW26 TaxID=2652722 RepID=UPI0012623D6A|nr:iron-containing alcohol dehydrogenase [Amylibacter sp. SFDW26]KAB7615214.1 iron-containing alcohol dehydrogenase [Amylibacter sp. SFDW26]
MKSFKFQTTSSILSEVGSTGKIGQLMTDLGCQKVAFVTDSLILELGLATAALDSLKAAGITVYIIDDVVADPPEAMIRAAVEQAKSEGIDGVVSVGGGSSMDTAKLISVLARPDRPQDLDEMYGVDMVKGGRLPLILAPTTAGTGSEVTPISIVTTRTSEKKGVVSAQLYPDWAILDAELTIGLPAHVTAATGIDAMVHAIEAYTTKHAKNILSDTLARQALQLLGGAIHKACTQGEDREARSDMLLGSMLAGMAFANAPVAAVHALAYPLGGHFHVPHGLSNALVLPHVLEFNMEDDLAASQYSEIAPIIFPELKDKSNAEICSSMVQGFKDLGPDLGMKSTLREVGVNHNDLPMLAEDSMKQTRLLVNNPREMTYDAALAIYTAAL